MKVLLKISKVAEFVGDLSKFNVRSRKARFRCRSTHVPNLTDELSTAKERRLNQFGTAVLVWCQCLGLFTTKANDDSPSDVNTMP